MSWQQNCSRALKNWLLLLQDDEDCIGCAGIKASCGLIQKKDWWLCDELHPNVGSLPFPSRHSPNQFSSYLQAEEIKYLQQDLVSACSGIQGSRHPAALSIFRVPLVNFRVSSRWWVCLSVRDCVAVSRARFFQRYQARYDFKEQGWPWQGRARMRPQQSQVTLVFRDAFRW